MNKQLILFQKNKFVQKAQQEQIARLKARVQEIMSRKQSSFLPPIHRNHHLLTDTLRINQSNRYASVIPTTPNHKKCISYNLPHPSGIYILQA